MCKYLVQLGIDANLVDNNKHNVFHYAKKFLRNDIIRYLTDLKNAAKKTKQLTKVVQESSQQQSKGPRKKKELMKAPYCLIYTNQKGQVHELTVEEL